MYVSTYSLLCGNMQIVWNRTAGFDQRHSCFAFTISISLCSPTCFKPLPVVAFSPQEQGAFYEKFNASLIATRDSALALCKNNTQFLDTASARIHSSLRDSYAWPLNPSLSPSSLFLAQSLLPAVIGEGGGTRSSYVNFRGCIPTLTNDTVPYERYVHVEYLMKYIRSRSKLIFYKAHLRKNDARNVLRQRMFANQHLFTARTMLCVLAI